MSGTSQPSGSVPRVTASHPSAPVSAEDRLGTFLSGWRLDGLLGTSETNTVYAVSDRSGEPAALRLLHVERRGDSGARRRAFREAAHVRRLDHPGTARVLVADVTAHAEPYVVMERLYGLDAGALLRARGSGVRPEVALAIVEEVLEVLARGHDEHLIHRGVHLPTVFCGADGVVRVLDWGAAWSSDDDPPLSLADVGVQPHPMLAPEVTAGANPVLATDVYGAGLVLVSLLTGDAMEGPRGDLSEVLAHVDAALSRSTEPFRHDVADLVGRVLHEDPRQRMPTAQAMLRTVRGLRERLTEESTQTLVAGEVDRWYEGPALDDGLHRAWQSADALRAVFGLVESALYSARRSGWEDEESIERTEAVLSDLLDVVRDDDEGVSLTIRPQHVESRGRIVWEPRAPFDVIPYHLFDAGFRRLRVLPGIDRDECRRFLRWLVTDPDRDLASEDDLATMWWREAFRHVRCDLVSSVVLQDMDEYDVLDRELRRLRANAVDEIREALAARLTGQHDIDAPADATAEDEDEIVRAVHRDAAVVLPPDVLEGLGEELDGKLPDRVRRLSEIVGRSWLDAEAVGDGEIVVSAFRLFAEERRREEESLEAVAVFAGLCAWVTDPDARRRFARPFADPVVLRDVLTEVAPLSGRRVPESRIQRSLGPFTMLLDVLGPEVFSAVLNALASTEHPRLIEVFEAWLTKYAHGRSKAIGERLSLSPAVSATAMLRAIWADPDEDAAVASLDALSSRFADVRLDAYARLVAHAPEEATEPFAELLVDATPQVRRSAIRIAVDGGLVGASMALARRTRDGAFDKLPLAERHAVFSALLHLAPEEAEEALGWLVVNEKAFTDPEHDRTRKLAADLLGELGGPGAIQHLKGVTGLRFWTAKAIRQAAKDAIRKIESRHGTGG